jgi:polysaccharide deacetylase 2 family uncharacterized protein YibQ
MKALAWFWAAVAVLALAPEALLSASGPPPSMQGHMPGPTAASSAPSLPLPVPTPSSSVAPPPRMAAAPSRVAILVAGMGMIAADSRSAIGALPGPVSFAISPYAADPAAFAQAARAAGHEVVLSLPMQPSGGAAVDAGAEALIAGLDSHDTATRLAWALGRVPNPAGTTSLLGPGLDGGAFTASPFLVAITDTLAARHLWFLDARRLVMLDVPGARPDQAFAALLAEARARGEAIGAIGAPAPEMVTALAEFLRGLAAQGARLVPVGEIVTESKQ